MIRGLAVVAAAFMAAPDLLQAQTKPKDDPIAASRFGISVDGVQKPKSKGLKSSSGKKRSGAQLQNAWPKKTY